MRIMCTEQIDFSLNILGFGPPLLGNDFDQDQYCVSKKIASDVWSLNF